MRVSCRPTGFCRTAQEVSQRLVAEKIKPLLRHFELDVARGGVIDPPRSRPVLHAGALLLGELFFAQAQVALLDQPLDQLVDQLFELRAAKLTIIFGEHLGDIALIEFSHLDERLQ